jgi:hypothetical protein
MLPKPLQMLKICRHIRSALRAGGVLLQAGAGGWLVCLPVALLGF